MFKFCPYCAERYLSNAYCHICTKKDNSMAMAVPLHVQNVLFNKVETLESLERRYALSIKRHKEFPELVQFTYKSYESPMDNPLVLQCRGLILNEAKNWECVARPFDKFFNVGEPQAAKIDWPSATVFEKLDGSLIILYAYKGSWHAATTGSPDASGEVNGSGMTFKELFWSVWNRKGLHAPINEYMTFMFELTTQLNKVVVDHKEPDVRLIGIRDRVTGHERPLGFFSSYPCTRSYHLTSVEDIIKTFDVIKPTEQEGYVITDGYFNRVKVKHPEYVKLHRMIDNFTPRGLLEFVRKGEGGEIAACFPEWKTTIEAIQESFDRLANEIEAVWILNSSIESEKEFALAVYEAPYRSVLFGLKSGKVSSVKDGLSRMHIDRLGDLVGIGEAIAKGIGVELEHNGQINRPIVMPPPSASDIFRD